MIIPPIFHLLLQSVHLLCEGQLRVPFVTQLWKWFSACLLVLSALESEHEGVKSFGYAVIVSSTTSVSCCDVSFSLLLWEHCIISVNNATTHNAATITNFLAISLCVFRC